MHLPTFTQGDLWGLSTVVLSFMDWPLRRAFPGFACLSKARPCKPGTHAYDEKVRGHDCFWFYYLKIVGCRLGCGVGAAAPVGKAHAPLQARHPH